MFQKLARPLQPIKRTTTKTRVTARRQNKNKKLQERPVTKTKTGRERTECFGYFAFLVVPQHARVVEVEKNRLTGDTATAIEPALCF